MPAFTAAIANSNYKKMHMAAVEFVFISGMFFLFFIVPACADPVQDGIYQACLQNGLKQAQGNNEAFCVCYVENTAQNPNISEETKQKLTQTYPANLNDFMGGKISIGGTDPKSVEAGELLRIPFYCLDKTGVAVKALPAKPMQGACSPDGKVVSKVGPNGTFDSLCLNGQWTTQSH